YRPVTAGKHAAGLVVSAADSALEVALGGQADAPAPVAATPPPTPPAPRPAPAPKILRLSAKPTADGAQVCYRVDNATELTLEPRPGALRNAREDCVVVPLPRTVSLTLIARGEGGQAAARVEAGPLPTPAEVVRTPAPAATHARQPAVGDSWTYRSRGKWATSPKRSFTLRVGRVENALVYESLTILEPERERGKSLRSQGTAPGFIDWGAIGWEFSPWLMAFEALDSSSQWRGIPTPRINNWGDWNTTARAVGVETVSVPAGRFKAIEVEVWARRQPTDGSTRAGQEPTSVKFNIWYAIESKRYVKMVRIITAANSQRLEEDTIELVEYQTR
ncbi:MAG: hypothetical protein KDF24_14685, partial [Rhodocyclaceae bacterium]|nr:hypothetical protein [Rhodocyclaceae bacterium]